MTEHQPVNFDHFARYLRAKADTRELVRLKGGQGFGGCFIALSMFPLAIGFASEVIPLIAAGLGLFMIGMIALAVASAKAGVKIAESRRDALYDGHVLLEEAIWMDKRKELEKRCHPRLIPMLEACAKARSNALRCLNSPAWTERAKEEKWAELRTAAKEAVESAMFDALWASRNLIRRKGWRQTTFENNCADPEYGKFAFARLELIKKEMEDLANHVSDEVYTHPLEQSSIRNVLEDLKAVHDAKVELDRDVPRLTD